MSLPASDTIDPHPCRRRVRAPARGVRAAAIVAAASGGLGLAALSGACWAGDGVQPFSSEYQGRKSIALITATATARIDLRRSARHILYSMVSTVTWALLERRFRDCSVIEVDGDTMLPLEYVHTDESSPDHDVHTRFDWTEKTATTVLGDKPDPAVVPIAWPTWDPMSFQVALIALAQQRPPGQREPQRVIERGVVKDYQVRFSGAVSLPGRARGTPLHEVISQKKNGSVALYLLPGDVWRPYSITIDDVTIELVNGPADVAPASLPDGQVPQCDTALAR